MAYIHLVRYKFEPDIVKVNGTEIDIAEFMNGSKRIIPDKTERRKYCICVVTKLAQNETILETYADELMKGRIDKILIDLESSPQFEEFNFHECLDGIENFELNH